MPLGCPLSLQVLVLAPCSKCEVSLLDSTLISNLASYGFQVHVLQDKGYVTEGFQVFGEITICWAQDFAC